MVDATPPPSRVLSQSTKSRAHFCFECPDITTLIVKEIEISDDHSRLGHTSRKNLVAFAYICCSTVDPALRVLWRSQTGLDNLIRTLPADAWKMECVGRVERVFKGHGDNEEDDSDEETVGRTDFMQNKREIFSLTRPLSSFEWQRFDYYAAFIQSLTVGPSSRYFVPIEWSPDVSLALQLHRSILRRPLLPNLKGTTLIRSGKALLSTALFLPPTLKHVFLFGCEPLWTQAFLSYFPGVSPEVELIYISSLDDRGKPIDIHPLLECVHLRSLMICNLRISVESALKLAQLPYLEGLTLSLIRRTASPNPSHRSNSYVFHQVKLLECDSSPEFFQAAHFPALQSFKITDGSRIRDSLDALWKHCTPDILCKFAISYLNPSSSLTPQDIQRMYSFHSLEHVDIRIPRCTWNDQALELMASAWLGLRELSIHSTPASDQDGFTLLGLIHLAKHCPQLRSLSLHIRERNPPISLSDLPEDGPSNFHLESICLRDTDIEQSQCDTVAAFLFCLFPNLRRIEKPSGCDTPSWGGWTRVEELLAKFGAVRAYLQRE